MPQTINVPGVGQLQFPDGMSQPEMAAAIQKNFPQIHAPSVADQIPLAPGAAERMQAEAAANPVNHSEPSFLDKVTGGLEAARSTVTGMTSGALGYVGGALGGIAGSIASGDFGTERGVRLAKEAAENGAASLTYTPKTELGQAYTKRISDALENSGIVGVPIPEIEALARSLPIARNRIPGPAARAVAPAIDYDVPAYQRNGIKGPPEPAPAPTTVPAAPEVPAPILPPSSAPVASPLDAYAVKPIPSPFGDLPPIAPIADIATPVTPLDQYVAQRDSPATFGELWKRSNHEPEINDAISQMHPSEAVSPLDSLIAKDSPASALTAGLRDTSDIDAVLANFGVKTPEPIPGPRAIPTETVERATAPAVPIDSALVAPEPIPGPGRPAAPAEVVQRAEPGAVVPIDDSVRVPTEQADQPFVPTPERHVDPARREQNLQTLRDVGLENIRESAVSGNAAQAAREFQHGKITSEPAGQHWFDQFQHETDAMKNYGQRLVEDTKGRTGLDSESLESKGRDIAAPYDAARQYFEKAKKNLYDMADKESGGLPLKSTANIEKLLVDREFNNTALADKTLDLVQAVKQQFELHKERNGGSLTVKEAESFRKWLNKRWTPDNSKIIGAIKDALDEDVFSSAGQDVYAAGRQMHQLEIKTLDDPNGISKLMDSDPRAPINRATPYEAIPNALVKLSNDQFKHIIDTYKALPPELQPLAKQAIATLKAHYAERLVNAGTETGRGNPRQLWDAGGVKKFTSDNSAKLPMIFDADEMARIGTLLDAGEILRVNPAYPGAAAQLANASKAGMMSNLLGRAGGGIGGMVGAFTAGPAGAAAGGLAGEAAASSLLKRSGERKALAEAKAAIINEHRTAPKPRSPVDEWEAGLR